MSVKVIEKKKKVVDKLKEKIDSASLVILSDYRRVSVKEITELRKSLRTQDAEYKIIKNSLLTRAMGAAGFAELQKHLKGPIAVLFGYEEPVAPLKTLVEFIKDIEKGEIKAGILEKNIVAAQVLSEIAKLPPKEILLARMVSGFQSPICGLVNVLQGTIRKLVYALNAVKEKKGGEKDGQDKSG